VRENGWQRIYHIGPERRSRPLMQALPGLVDRLADADAIVCSGLVDDRRETAEDYRAMMQEALQRRLPFVCANPDLTVHVGADLLPCAGAIAALYESLGGPVHWAGKPHRPAYDTAFAKARDIRRAEVPASRVLAIGDALRTDLAGAAKAGVDALFIATGIHRDETMVGGEISAERLARLFVADAPRPVAAAVDLAW
jgi:HAD superfamily hydrolase (TIGR01459 family)